MWMERLENFSQSSYLCLSVRHTDSKAKQTDSFKTERERESYVQLSSLIFEGVDSWNEWHPCCVNGQPHRCGYESVQLGTLLIRLRCIFRGSVPSKAAMAKCGSVHGLQEGGGRGSLSHQGMPHSPRSTNWRRRPSGETCRSIRCKRIRLFRRPSVRIRRKSGCICFTFFSRVTASGNTAVPRLCAVWRLCLFFQAFKHTLLSFKRL